MVQMNPYLAFDGNCADAMRFYEKALPGTMRGMMTYGESPMREQIPAGSENRVMHAQLALDNPAMVIMASDTMPGQPYEGMKGMMLALTYDTVAQAQTTFAALSEGGRVLMAPHPTFWAEIFGMVVDRFGTPWTINGGPLHP